MPTAHLYRPVQDSEGNLITDLQVRLMNPGSEVDIVDPVYVEGDLVNPVAQPISVPSGIISLYLPHPRIVRLSASYGGGITDFFEDVPVGFPQRETLSWSIAGAVSIQNGLHRIYIEEDSVVRLCRVSAGIAPVGSELAFDVKKNGVSIFTGTSPLVIAADEHTTLYDPDEEILLEAGSYLTFDTLAIGTNFPGAHIVLQIHKDRA